MEYQKIANLLDTESNKPSKFRTRNWVEINDEARGTYSHNKQIKFKTSMLRSSLCDYSDAYILAKGNIACHKIASKKVIQKIAEATGDLIGNKIADKITRISKKLIIIMKMQK